MVSTSRRWRGQWIAVVATVLLASTVPAAHAQERRGAEDATVVGVVVDGAGKPLAAVPVVVTEGDTGIGGAFGGVALGLFTLGLACLAGVCTYDADEIVDRVETGADGSYSANLPDAYVAGKETDADWFVRASLPATGVQRSGASSAFEFETNIQTQAAPPLPVWGADPVVAVDGWGVSIDVGAPPKSLGNVGVALGSPTDTLSASGTHATFDARLLETPARSETQLAIHGSASADVRVNHANGRTIYHQRSTTAVLPVNLVTVPISRGAACTARSSAGEVRLSSATPAVCPLTDGDLTSNLTNAVSTAAPTSTSTSTSSPPVVTEATVDLLTPVDASLIVLRGAAAGPVIDLSTDGTTWTTVRTVAPPNGSLPMAVAAPPTGTQARFVRVRDPQGLNAAEVSVWTPRPVDLPAAPAGSGPPATQADGSVAPTTAVTAHVDEPKEASGGLKLFALASVALVWLALAREQFPRKRR